jgi:hypothetical protein
LCTRGDCEPIPSSEREGYGDEQVDDPLLAATAIGAAAGGVLGKVARKRAQAGIGEKMDDALPPGSAGIIAIYDHDDSRVVAGALGNSIRSSIAQIDKASAKELKAGLEEASSGLAG